MTDLPTIPKAAAIVAGGVIVAFASADFSGTVTLGSIVLGLILVGVAGYFAVHAKHTESARATAESWREAYEAEAARRRQAEDAILKQRDEQQELRHALKNELAACQLALDVEKRKPDLSVLIELSRENYASAMRDVTAMFEGVTRTQQEIVAALKQLAER